MVEALTYDCEWENVGPYGLLEHNLRVNCEKMSDAIDQLSNSQGQDLFCNALCVKIMHKLYEYIPYPFEIHVWKLNRYGEEELGDWNCIKIGVNTDHDLKNMDGYMRIHVTIKGNVYLYSMINENCMVNRFEAHKEENAMIRYLKYVAEKFAQAEGIGEYGNS